MVAAFSARLECYVLLYIEPAGTTVDEHLARRVAHVRLKTRKMKIGRASMQLA